MSTGAVDKIGGRAIFEGLTVLVGVEVVFAAFGG